MPDYTSRLSLAKPRGGSSGSTPAEQVAIDMLNGNFDKLDASIGAPSYTSTTRPVSPFPGQVIYEIDTQAAAAYIGSSWTYLMPGTGIPYGFIARRNAPATPSSGDIVALENTLTYDDATLVLRGGMQTSTDRKIWTVPLAGRYRVTKQTQWSSNGNGTRSLWVIKNVAASVTPNATDIANNCVQQIDVVGSSQVSGYTYVSKTLILQANDTLQFWERQTSGGALAIVPGTNTQNVQSTFIQIEYLGA